MWILGNANAPGSILGIHADGSERGSRVCGDSVGSHVGMGLKWLSPRNGRASRALGRRGRRRVGCGMTKAEKCSKGGGWGWGSGALRATEHALEQGKLLLADSWERMDSLKDIACLETARSIRQKAGDKGAVRLLLQGFLCASRLQ